MITLLLLLLVVVVIVVDTFEASLDIRILRIAFCYFDLYTY